MSGEQVPEFYTDNFVIGGSPFGVTLNFNKSKRTPPAPGERMEYEAQVTIRMSWEHFKSIIYLGWRHIRQAEQKSGVSYSMPTRLLAEWGVALEDWQAFWRPTPPEL